MVILAVHVGGERSAKRDEASAGSDGREKTARQKDVDQLGDGDAGLASQDAGGGVEGEHPVEPRQIDDPVLIVQRRVAIGAARAARDQRSRVGGHDRLQFSDFIGPVDIAFGQRITAPSGEQGMARVRRRGRGIRHGEKVAASLRVTGRPRPRNARGRTRLNERR